MAPSRDQRPEDRRQPPPYDGWQSRGAHAGRPAEHELVSPIFAQMGQQTIPKSSEADAIAATSVERLSCGLEAGGEGRPGQRAAASHHHSVPTGNSGSHSSASGGRNQRPADSTTSEHREFVNSLAAPKSSFFGHITVEPLAFLAIMALYLEFPAIQDLIYTKVCLEVVASHPGSLDRQRVEPAASNATDHTRNETQIPSNFSLPSNGRIQQLVVSSDQGARAAPTSQPSGIYNSSVPTETDLHLVCDRWGGHAPAEIHQEILDANSLFWLKYQILICLLSALCSPYWGGVSDKIGRLLPMNVTIVASILCNAISLAFGLLLSLDSHAAVHLNWLYAGAVLVGLSGGQQVLLMNAFSFISDNTSSEQRSKRVTVLESVIIVGHSAGFFLSKLIMPLGLAGPSEAWCNRHFVSFAACIALNMAGLLHSSCRLRHRKFHKFLNNFEREQQEAARMGAHNLAASSSSMVSDVSKHNGELALQQGHLVGSCDRLRELTSTTPDDPDGPIAKTDRPNWSVWDTLITFRYYRQTYEIATKPRDTRAPILLLLLLGFLSALSLTALLSLFFIFVKMDPFNWPTSKYSAWNAYSSITRGSALIVLTLLMKFVPAWRAPDALVAAIGFVGKGAGLLMLGLAHSTALVNWALVPFAFSEFSMPPIRSLLSKLVFREELCKIYSCLSALQSLCFILGNLVFYLAFTSYVPRQTFRLVFIVVGGIELAALLLVLVIHATIKRQLLAN